MTAHPFTDPDADETTEDLAAGGTWLLDLVAAVDHLRRGHRPDLTVWDALAEALDRSGGEHVGRAASQGCVPLATSLAELVRQGESPLPEAMQAAIRRWVTTMADRYNNGYFWPHPAPRRGFPPPLIDV